MGWGHQPGMSMLHLLACQSLKKDQNDPKSSNYQVTKVRKSAQKVLVCGQESKRVLPFRYVASMKYPGMLGTPGMCVVPFILKNLKALFEHHTSFKALNTGPPKQCSS